MKKSGIHKAGRLGITIEKQDKVIGKTKVRDLKFIAFPMILKSWAPLNVKSNQLAQGILPRIKADWASSTRLGKIIWIRLEIILDIHL